jgi:hypothetical protein
MVVCLQSPGFAIAAWLRSEATEHIKDIVFASDDDKRLLELCFKFLELAAEFIERGDHMRPHSQR